MRPDCEFGHGCKEGAVGHYDAEFWSGPALSVDVCRRHLVTLLLAAAAHIPYGEGPARASWWIFTDLEGASVFTQRAAGLQPE
jgi:hypothetical protein